MPAPSGSLQAKPNLNVVGQALRAQFKKGVKRSFEIQGASGHQLKFRSPWCVIQRLPR